jgi:predicted DCC family thiol-disulfide oxidoreductase YuxK
MEQVPVTPEEPSFEVFFDGECPICRREIAWLARKTGSKVEYTDIRDPNFHPEQYGLSSEDFLSAIRGRRRGGEFLVGMEVIRELYRYAGFGWVMAPTGWSLLKPFFDRCYQLFAKNRMWLTGKSCSERRCR